MILFSFVNYVFLILCLCILFIMYVPFVYSVQLYCSVYCFCVNVYVLLPPGVNPIAVNKYTISYHIISHSMYHASETIAINLNILIVSACSKVLSDCPEQRMRPMQRCTLEELSWREMHIKNGKFDYR